MKKLFRDYADFLDEHFPFKVQKLSINAGFSCPNRDGTISRGGCAYCNNLSFTPSYCQPSDSVGLQLKKGAEFFGRKYPEMRYLAYFQSNTNTHAPLSHLQALYEETLSQDQIVGLVIGTRPDAVSEELLDYLGSLARKTFVMIEYGVESTDNQVLRAINRGHDFATSVSAINRTHEHGIFVGAHIILGLPLSTRAQMLDETRLISEMPLDILKLHQLQIIKSTPLAQTYQNDPESISLFSSPQDYATLVIDYIERLRPNLALERFTSQSPDSMLIAPRWGMKNYQFTELLKKLMRQRQTWQGRLWTPKPQTH